MADRSTATAFQVDNQDCGRCLTRRSATIGLLGAFLVSSAGCLHGFWDDDDDPDRQIPPSFAGLPGRTDGLVHVETRLPDPDTSADVVDDIVAGGSGATVEAGPTVGELLTTVIESPVGDDFEEATVFFETEPGAQAYVGMVVRTDGESDAVFELLESELPTMEAATDEGFEDVYETGEATPIELIAMIHEDLLVVGTEAAVIDSIGAHDAGATEASDAGDGQPGEDGDRIDSDLEEAYLAAAAGQVTVTMGLEGDELTRAAAEINPEFGVGLALLPTIEIVSAVYDESNGEVSLELQLTMGSQRDAEDAERAIENFIALETDEAAGDADADQPIDEQSIFERIDLHREDVHVRITVPMTHEEVIEYFEVYARALADELGHEDALARPRLSGP